MLAITPSALADVILSEVGLKRFSFTATQERVDLADVILSEVGLKLDPDIEHTIADVESNFLADVILSEVGLKPDNILNMGTKTWALPT